jgi:hypothetical protein
MLDAVAAASGFDAVAAAAVLGRRRYSGEPVAGWAIGTRTPIASANAEIEQPCRAPETDRASVTLAGIGVARDARSTDRGEALPPDGVTAEAPEMPTLPAPFPTLGALLSVRSPSRGGGTSADVRAGACT